MCCIGSARLRRANERVLAPVFDVTMSQSDVIFFYVFAAFFVFITMRGELPKYMGFLLLPPKGQSVAPVGPTQVGSAGANDKLATLAQFATLLG